MSPRTATNAVWPDGDEILDVRWFSRENHRPGDGPLLPGPSSIARAIIEHWYGGPLLPRDTASAVALPADAVFRGRRGPPYQRSMIAPAIDDGQQDAVVRVDLLAARRRSMISSPSGHSPAAPRRRAP